jgi:hypothetical protein
VVDPNPKPNPITNVGAQSLMTNNSPMTPADGQLTNPSTIPDLPKPNGWKPGAVIQVVITAAKDVINGLTRPFTPKPGAGSSNPQSTSGSQAAA